MKKKHLNYLLVTIIGLFSFINVNATTIDICKTDVLEGFFFAGVIIFIAKILVPLIIIILGSISLFKVVLNGEEKEMSSAITSIVKKLAAGVIVFFIPTIVLFIVGFISNFGSDGIEDQFMICTTCVLDPFSNTCSSDLECVENPDNFGCEGFGTINQQLGEDEIPTNNEVDAESDTNTNNEVDAESDTNSFDEDRTSSGGTA